MNGLITNRQMQVLQGIASGKTGQQVARDLGIRYTTVRSHVHAVNLRLGTSSATQAIMLLARRGWLGVFNEPPEDGRPSLAQKMYLEEFDRMLNGEERDMLAHARDGLFVDAGLPAPQRHSRNRSDMLEAVIGGMMDLGRRRASV